MNITEGRLYGFWRKLGLKPNRFRADYLALRQKAHELNRDGQSLEQVAEHFNEQRLYERVGKIVDT